ncbi:MAG: VOC family protein [Micromonosporaceae bacterium]
MSAMAIARFKDLCIDAASSRRMSEFWAAVIGLGVSYQESGDAALSGARPTDKIWVNVVPEKQTVKHRVHLDVAAHPSELVALGATVLRQPDDEIRWTVMADVEGGELCAFPPGEFPRRLIALVVDAGDAEAQARWWAEVLGAVVRPHSNGWFSAAEIPHAPYGQMLFIPVPEPKTVKNRIHWDITADSKDPLLARGAHLLRAADDEINWDVLADPEGNEFCVFGPRRD